MGAHSTQMKPAAEQIWGHTRAHPNQPACSHWHTDTALVPASNTERQSPAHTHTPSQAPCTHDPVAATTQPSAALHTHTHTVKMAHTDPLWRRPGDTQCSHQSTGTLPRDKPPACPDPHTYQHRADATLPAQHGHQLPGSGTRGKGAPRGTPRPPPHAAGGSPVAVSSPPASPNPSPSPPVSTHTRAPTANSNPTQQQQRTHLEQGQKTLGSRD